MKRALRVLIVAVFAGILVFWRLGAEPGRRYERIEALLFAHRDSGPYDWSDEDRRELWEHLVWFSRKRSSYFEERLLDSVLEGDSQARLRAAHLAADLELFDEVGKRPRFPNEIYASFLLPDPAGVATFSSGRLRPAERLSEAGPQLRRLQTDADRDVRYALLYLDDRKPRPRVWESLRDMAATDPDLELRVKVTLFLHRRGDDPDTTALLSRLLADPAPRIRFAAAAVLCDARRPEGFEPLVDLGFDPESGIPPAEWERGFGLASNAEAILLRDSLRAWTAAPGCTPGAIAEIRERWMRALERGRIGERLQPRPE